MPSLLELTSQGDVGTISDESKLSSVKLMDPQQLYELWERQQWQSHAIDLSRDRRDWASMEDDLRENLAWNLSSFFVGEERVTTQFSGLVMSYESQSEEAFLATQQVDEARHAQHFNRFYEQVLEIDGASRIASRAPAATSTRRSSRCSTECSSSGAGASCRTRATSRPRSIS